MTDVEKYKKKFEEGVERKGTSSVKWDNLIGAFGTEDALPMWVADTDFPCPDEVIDALRKKVEHGVYGYSFPVESAYETVKNKLEKDYGWKVEKDWIVFIDGIVGGLYSGVEAFSEREESILIQQPVYFPFANAIVDKSRNLVNNPLKLSGGKYRMDFEQMAECFDRAKKEEKGIKAAILCNPHNPVGRVWETEELKKFGELCIQNDTVIISDEIHCDILLNGHSFTPFASLSKEFENHSVTFMAASKTYNIAGFHQSFAVIPNEELRKKFNQVRSGSNWGNGFGLTAMEYSYKFGQAYKEALNQYIWENYIYFSEFLKQRIPSVTVIEPEGTYLLWVDFSATGKTEEEIKRMLLEDCKLAVNTGSAFGTSEGLYMRFNIGCSRKNLEQALSNMERVFGRKK